MAARKTSPKQTASKAPENKTAAPADAETAAIGEETAATPDAATVATAQPEREPAAAGEDKDAAAPANDTASDDEKAEEEAEVEDGHESHEVRERGVGALVLAGVLVEGEAGVVVVHDGVHRVRSFLILSWGRSARWFHCVDFPHEFVRRPGG